MPQKLHFVLIGLGCLLPPQLHADEREGRARYESDQRDVDNTGINERDRDSTAVTPFNQSYGKAQTQLTAQIRSAIVARDDLSTTAKNVKVITTDNGEVTLRGPVETAAEKEVIVKIARNAAKNTKVNDLLEVTTEEESAPVDTD